ncbi:esterase [Mycobacterium hodleri]|uniref:Esterase n=2 Tax=Mycolicibacterium hodleri TaxID=49897 RepID=A0A502DV55_9MYCO|nr:esterase [Mycolicibacterium hodleri]
MATMVLLAGSTACAANAFGAVDGQMEYGGLTRTYTLYVPPGVEHPSALVVNLHGGGGTGRIQELLTHYDNVADEHGFAVVYPDGIDRNWADGRGASAPDRQGVDDTGFLAALANNLVAQYGINPGRVFATGMSNGGFMANRLGCDRADVFAAIAPVAATLGSNVGCQPSRPISVMVTNGTADPLVPFGGGMMRGAGGTSDIVSPPNMAARWRALDRCPSDVANATLPGSAPVDQATASGCADGTEVVSLQVEGGGHLWPGGLPYPTLKGVATNAFDQSETSWSFFDRHGR